MVIRAKVRGVSLAVLAVVFVAKPHSAQPSIIGVNDLKPVSSLPEQSRIRRSSSGVGRLELLGDQGSLTCTAALISPSHLLTAAHCWSREIRSAQLVLGYMSREALGQRFRIKTAPVEINEQFNYTVLAVDGPPILDFEPATLLLRDPDPSEALYVLQYPGGDPLTFSTNCTVLLRGDGNVADAGKRLDHTCDTSPGSAGALVFSVRDNAVLGLQALGFTPGLNTIPHNEAVPLRQIAGVSPIVRDLAWIRPSRAPTDTVIPAPDEPVRAEVRASFTLDSDLETTLRSNPVLAVNGNSVNMKSAMGEAVFLGDTPSPGLNILRTGKDAVLAWLEERKLSTFERPYKNSYAVLVAIDDYNRGKDARRRGKTGFGQLGQMIPNAESLRKALLSVGFPNENIITLYDEQAESGAIERLLKSFWPGGERSKADRVFVYFGGHGSAYNAAGLLVTYDYDAMRPTLTSLLMRDLTGRQSDNIEARHVIFALDACGSGLAIQTLADPERDKRERARFRALSIIRNDTKPRARNVLVAGTGDQPAVYDSGGIFTNALIGGLSGSADLNGDRIIQFAELGVYVKDEVAFLASRKGVEQSVGYYKLTNNGAVGEILFIRGEKR